MGTAATKIERIATEEGFLLNSEGIYRYHYNLIDHLGNVRSVIKREGSATVPSVVQNQDYSLSICFSEVFMNSLWSVTILLAKPDLLQQV